MGIFGWSYPPGCTGTPYDDVFGECEVCGKDVDDCICPECPRCETVGDPRCYQNHGMIRTLAQITSRNEADKARADEVEAEKKFFEDLGNEPDWIF